MLINLLNPCLEIIKGLKISNGICQNDSHRTLKICLVYIFESFLACCVPYLQSYSLFVNLNYFVFKIDAHC